MNQPFRKKRAFMPIKGQVAPGGALISRNFRSAITCMLLPRRQAAEPHLESRMTGRRHSSSSRRCVPVWYWRAGARTLTPADPLET
jgi:hypothetical protein